MATFWTDAERSLLLERRRQKIGYREIGLELGRTGATCKAVAFQIAHGRPPKRADTEESAAKAQIKADIRMLARLGKYHADRRVEDFATSDCRVVRRTPHPVPPEAYLSTGRMWG